MQTKTNTDYQDIETLIEKIKGGDREAFMAITRLYQRKVFQLAYSFFRNHDDALDIVQETFLRFYQKIELFQTEKNFQNWLLQITKNLCIDYYRKNYKKNIEMNFPRSINDSRHPPDLSSDFTPASDLKEVLFRSLNKLTEKQRLIFVMKHFNHMKYTEIAQILSLAVGTVKSLNFKAIQNLRNHISPYLGSQQC